LLIKSQFAVVKLFLHWLLSPKCQQCLRKMHLKCGNVFWRCCTSMLIVSHSEASLAALSARCHTHCDW